MLISFSWFTLLLSPLPGIAPAVQHRVVQDDIGWGLCALLSVAERVEAELKKCKEDHLDDEHEIM
jgi:hypothetical protein